MPGPLREEMARVRDDAATADRVQLLVLADLLAAATARGVPLIVLKGLAVAERVLDDPAWRVSKDIDLLVPLDAVEVVGSLLRERGFDVGKLERTPQGNRKD